MKKEERITCDVIQDLMPLYEDGCCSEQTRKIVETHLAECEICGKKQHQYEKLLPLSEVVEEADVGKIRCGIKKFNRWKRGTIAALCLALAIILIVFPVWNYVRGTGLTYANLKAVRTAHSFEKALEAGDYEKAYSYLAIEAKYHSLLEDEKEMADSGNEHDRLIAEGIEEIRENGFDWYNDVCHEKFLESMQTLAALDENIQSSSEFRVSAIAPKYWEIRSDIRTAGGTDAVMYLQIGSEGIAELFISGVFRGSDDFAREEAQKEDDDKKDMMFDRLYRMPSINETVMEILYGDTDFDWENLFAY